MTILLIGGTGRVGSAALPMLLESGTAVRCLSHDRGKLAALPEGVERAFADLDDPSSLGAAFDGVSTVLLSLFVHPDEGRRGLGALAAAAAAEVKKVVHISIKHYPGSDDLVFYQGKQAIERCLARGDFKTVTIRPANFYQSDNAQKSYVMAGTYAPPIGRLGVDRIDVRDVGFAAARALLTDDYDGEDVELYGPKTLTGDTIALAYEQALGRPVKYLGDDIPRWVEMNAHRLGPWNTEALKGVYEQQQRYGMLRPQGVDQHPLLPRSLRTFDAFATELTATWTAPDPVRASST